MALFHFGIAHGDPRTPRQGNPPCLLGVIRVIVTVRRTLPVDPKQRTLSDRPSWSVWGQEATSHARFDMKEAAN